MEIRSTPRHPSENNSSKDQDENGSYDGQSHHTFRDTELDEFEASNLMKIQSLTSIINNPKNDTLFKQISGFIKSNPMEYRKMTEHSVPESLTLPKVDMKDFAPYLDSIREVTSLLLIFFSNTSYTKKITISLTIGKLRDQTVKKAKWLHSKTLSSSQFHLTFSMKTSGQAEHSSS